MKIQDTDPPTSGVIAGPGRVGAGYGYAHVPIIAEDHPYVTTYRAACPSCGEDTTWLASWTPGTSQGPGALSFGIACCV